MKARSKWSDVIKKCILDSSTRMRYNITATTVTDVAQLIIMLVGLLRSRREKHGLLRYIYIQVGGVVFRVPLFTMTAEHGLGLVVASRHDVSGGPIRGRF